MTKTLLAIKKWLKEKNIDTMIGAELLTISGTEGNGWHGELIESHFGLPINNSKNPDVIEPKFSADIKARLKGGTTKLTLGSCIPTNTNVRIIKSIIEKENGKPEEKLNETVGYGIKNMSTNGLYLISDTDAYPFDHLYIMKHVKTGNDYVVGSWTFDEYINILKKVENLIYVKTESIIKFQSLRIIDVDIFCGLDPARFFRCLERNIAVFEFKSSSAGDKGSCFRIDREGVYQIYKEHSSIIKKRNQINGLTYEIPKAIKQLIEEKEKEQNRKKLLLNNLFNGWGDKIIC